VEIMRDLENCIIRLRAALQIFPKNLIYSFDNLSQIQQLLRLRFPVIYLPRYKIQYKHPRPWPERQATGKLETSSGIPSSDSRNVRAYPHQHHEHINRELIKMRRQLTTMSAEKAGLPGSHPVTMPNRQVSTSSAMSDDAVPTTDPKDVRLAMPLST
jgi:hypothetical protein